MSIPYTYVYLIYDPFTKLHKIGKSDTPVKRCEDLSRQATILAAPSDYQLLQAWICPAVCEQEMHEEFKDCRVRGEWFQLTEDQVARVYEYFDWYRRWDGNEPEVAAKAERWKRLAIIWCDRAKEAEKERDSLLRQRAYLVKQRDDLLTFTEPEPEEAKSAAG